MCLKLIFNHGGTFRNLAATWIETFEQQNSTSHLTNTNNIGLKSIGFSNGPFGNAFTLRNFVLSSSKCSNFLVCLIWQATIEAWNYEKVEENCSVVYDGILERLQECFKSLMFKSGGEKVYLLITILIEYFRRNFLISNLIFQIHRWHAIRVA